MKKITQLVAVSASVVVLLNLTEYAQAQTVSVQFPPFYAQPYNTLNGNQNQGPSTSTIAGAVPEGYWNDAMGPSSAPDSGGGGDGVVTGPITNANLFTYIPNPAPGSPYPNNQNYTTSPTATLLTSTGAVSTLGFSLTGANSERGGNGDGNGFTGGSPGDASLVAGGAYNTGGAVSLSLTGLNPNDSYTLYAYAHADYYFYNNLDIEASLGGVNTFFTLNGANTLTGLTQATGTSTANANLADYVAYTAMGSVLDTESFSISGLTSTGSVTGGVGLAGFQLVDNGSGVSVVPEPSTWAMMLGGLGMLVFYVRRKSTSLR
jgi:hypothetical protein